MKIINKLMSFLVIFSLVMPVALMPAVASAITPTVIFSDGFESPTGLGNWTEVGWNSNGSSFHSGSKSANLVSAHNDQTMLKNISTSGYENITLSYWYKGQSLDVGQDKVELFYTLNGSTWTEITGAQIDSTNDDNLWHQFTFSSFPVGANNNPNFGIKFDGSLDPEHDHVWIDDFSLTGTQMVENTLALCTDNIDNDGDGQKDLADSDCASFKPQLTVTKVVVNDNGGTKVVSDFPLFVDGNSVTSGASNVYSVGSHTVSETSDANYTGVISGDCASDGSITLAAGDVKSCAITNDDNAPAPVIDVCPNLPENQTEVPSGYVKEGENCNPIPPPQCTPNEPMTIYSTVGDDVDGGPAVATWVHGTWASISGATWIWHEAQVSNPTSDETDVFTKTINITGDVTSASIDLATDNGYKIEVNDVVVVDNLASEFNYSAVATHNITNLHSGENTLKITVKNFALPDSTFETNPAGLLYKLTVNTQTCPPPVTTGTIQITKYECPADTTVVRSANGVGKTVPEVCTLQSEAKFGYVHGIQTDANSPYPELDSALTAGGSTDSNGILNITNLPSDGRYLVVETNSDNQKLGPSDILGLYCEGDGDTSDNNDNQELTFVPANGVTKCIAYNKKAEVPVVTTKTVKMCKYDDKQNPLSGWTLMLKGDKVQEGLTVPTNTSAGVNSDSLTSGTSYLALSSGTWMNQGGANPVDTEYSTTDSWATHMDGYTGYQTDILELQINNQFDPNSNWGAYNSLHKYAQSFIPSTTGPANFRIFDGSGTVQNEGWFGDNSGNLNVDIYKGYAGITGEDGCVTFSDVPYGSYTADELSQDNWSNTSGTGEVSVNADTNTINIVNHDNTNPAPSCVAGAYTDETDNSGAITFESPTYVIGSIGGQDGWSNSINSNYDQGVIANTFGYQSFGSQSFRISDAVTSGSFGDWVFAKPLVNGAGETSATASTFDVGTKQNHFEAQFDIASALPCGEQKGLHISVSPDRGDGSRMSYLRFEDTSSGLDVYFDDVSGTSAETINFDEVKIASGLSRDIPHKVKFVMDFVDGPSNDVVKIYIDGVHVHTGTSWENYYRYDAEASAEQTPRIVKTLIFQARGTAHIDNLGKGFLIDNLTLSSSTIGGDNSNNNEQNQNQNQNQERNTNSGGNGPINFGFVAPGGGQVLGASISKDDNSGLSCTPYLTTYMRMGQKNNVDEVKKLQTFLNEYLGLKLPITGFFGISTKNAVEQFQLKENIDVLGPWVKAGLYDSDKKPTGYVYKTTLRKINLIKCSTLDLPIPQLP